MSERPDSVLFGAPMPEPGVLSGGQRWTAALAIGLAALLLVAPETSRFVASPAASPGLPTTPAPPGRPGPRPQLTVEPVPAPALPEAPLAPPADVPAPAPPPEPAPAPAPEPVPPSDGGGSEDDAPPPCPVPVPPVVAQAGLCPSS